MDVQAEKNRLIEWIASLNDISTINLLKYLRDSTSKDWWDELSKEEKEGIQQGLKDIEEGRVRSHEEVMSDIKKRVGL
ncbi:hypothetical protein OOZ15_05635 [Galbibacter sp. EGI 63066]|uniref:hypothetical protein n=1 Tax=Galbibacter sp. EGI 63066 TaxID=2993559 RepID=UPI0022496730|nr:hypothetical protein [Galbibacter sp. EGI 63066]MCX2679418.1 hypothetical protein [Galbibacter sp. EGI 63066]